MQIQYRILNYVPEQASLLVNYFCDEVPDGITYAIDVPVIDGQLADEEEIMQLIQGYTPKGQLERLAALKTVEHPTHLTALMATTETVNTQTESIIDGDTVEVTRQEVAKLQLTLAIQRVLAEMAGATV
jgi:hypothetical protein